jgi:hypothetical protein
VVDGWNNSVSTPTPGNSTDAQNDYPFGGKAITGQLNITAPGKNANICQSFIYSPAGENAGDPTENGPVFVYDIWGNWNPTFVKDSALTLGFNIDFGYNGADGSPENTQATNGSVAVPNNGPNGFPNGVNGSETWYGVALYAQYKLTKVVTLAARGEYLHSSAAYNPLFGATGLAGNNAGGNVVQATPSQDDFSETLTASFAIWDNLLTRVEYRVDVLSAGSGGTHTVTGGPNNGATILNGSSVQNEISLEAVYSF